MQRKLLFLAVLALMSAAGCERSRPRAAGSNEAREREAALMLETARAAPIPQKVDGMRRVTALYDDLPIASEAHYELVLYLRMDPRETSDAAAVRAAKAFAERKPDDPRVSGAFYLVMVKAFDATDGTGDEALSAWRAWLDRKLNAEKEPSADLLFEAAKAASFARRWDEAASYAERSALGLPDGDPSLLGRRVERLLFAGDAYGYRCGETDVARRLWFAAIESAPEIVGAGIGAPRSLSSAAVAARVVSAPLSAVNAAYFRVAGDPRRSQ